MSATSPEPLADSPTTQAELSQTLPKSWRERLRAPRHLSLTRPGKFFLLLTLAVGFGAINTGNNLLFLHFGMMLSLIIASGLLSEAVIRHVQLRRRLPRRLEAGRPAPAAFRLTNHAFWPALSIEAAEQNPRSTAGPARGQFIGPQSIPWWQFWRSPSDKETRHIGAAYCLRAAAGEETLLSTHYEFPDRGRYFLPGVQVLTRFPFGLFEKSRQFDAPAQLLVYPAPASAEDWLGKLDARVGETARDKRGRGEEFFGLRDYRPGEDHRAIHWKSTARRGEPVVRVTEARRRRAVAVILDNRAPAAEISADIAAQFERGLSRLAGFLQVLSRRGYRLELFSCDGHVAPAAPGDVDTLLQHLAVIDLHQAGAAPPARPDAEAHELTTIDVGFGSSDLSFDEEGLQ